MTARTYTLDADLCDAWVKVTEPPYGADVPMFNAIRAQQPKPRIPWKQGLRVRNISSAHVYLLTDEKREARAVCVDAPLRHAGDVGILIHGLHGVDVNDTLDPALWEVVE